MAEETPHRKEQIVTFSVSGIRHLIKHSFVHNLFIIGFVGAFIGGYSWLCHGCFPPAWLMDILGAIVLVINVTWTAYDVFKENWLSPRR